jgi:hypothetical protein
MVRGGEAPEEEMGAVRGSGGGGGLVPALAGTPNLILEFGGCWGGGE